MSWALRFDGVGNAFAPELGSAMATIERDGAPWLTIDCGGEGLTNYLIQYGGTYPSALFITHAGLGSVHETLWNGVPFVAVPQQFEQMRNALAAARGGAGVILDDAVYGRPVRGGQLRAAVDTTAYSPGEAMTISVPAAPYDFELDPASTALVIIDMQRDFLYPGGFGSLLGNDVALLQTTIAPLQRVLAAARAAGMAVIHTREGHRPDLSDAPPAKLARGRLSCGIGDPGPASLRDALITAELAGVAYGSVRGWGRVLAERAAAEREELEAERRQVVAAEY